MRFKRTTALFLAAVMATTPVLCGCENSTTVKKKSFAVKYHEEEDKYNPSNIEYTEGLSVLTLDEDPDSEDESERFDAFLNDLFLDMQTRDTSSLHFTIEHPQDYGIDTEVTLGNANDFNTYSDDIFKKIEEGLKEFTPEKLGDNQRIMYELLSYEFSMYKEAEAFETDYICPYFSQNGEVLSGIQSAYTEFSLQEEKDVETYVELLKLLPDYLEDIKPLITESVVDKNELLTQSMYDNALESADSWITEDYKKNIIYVSFASAIKEVGLDEETEEEYLGEVAEIVTDSIIPAIKDFKDFETGFENEIDEAKGLACFEGGKDYYAYLMESYIGVGCSVDELFEYAFNAFIDVETEMTDLARKHPSYLISAPKSEYGDEPDEILSALADFTADEFPNVGEVSWICSYLREEQTEDHVVAYYVHPQLDNINRNVIRINGDSISDSVELIATLAHEGIPGHLYQQQYEYQDEPYEEVNSGLSYFSYQEGWAVYSEKKGLTWLLGDQDAGQYYYDEGVLNYLLVTCADILVNYYGYSKDEVNSWMAEKIGYSVSSIYDFVVSDPCLYTYYGLGPVLVEDTLTALAEAGNDEKTCYSKFLDIGPAPFTLVWDELDIENPVKNLNTGD